jgi:hypothetical protein
MTRPRPIRPRQVKMIDVEERNDASEVLNVTLKDPNMHARWVKDHGNRITRHKGRGYRFATAADIKGEFDYDDRGDTKIRIADAILMVCPRGRFEKRQRGHLELNQMRMEGTREKLAEEVMKHAGRKATVAGSTDTERGGAPDTPFEHIRVGEDEDPSA